MILSRAHDLDRPAITEGENGNLPAGHILLYDHAVSCHAELPVEHYLFYSRLRFLLIAADKNSLAKRKSVSLKDYGILRCLQVFKSLVRIIKYLVGGSRYTEFLHKIL